MNDLDQLLGDIERDLTLRVPHHQVVARGRTLRRRRRTRDASAVALATAGGVIALATITGHATPRSTGTTQVAAGPSTFLGGPPTGATAIYSGWCREEGEKTGGFPALTNAPRDAQTLVMTQSQLESASLAPDTLIFRSTPIASTYVGGDPDLVVLAYREGSTFANCVVEPHNTTGPKVVQLQWSPHFVETGPSVTSTGTSGPPSRNIAVGTIAPDVAAVRINIGGASIGATVDNGVFVALMPRSATHETSLKSTVDALSATGIRLQRIPLLPENERRPTS